MMIGTEYLSWGVIVIGVFYSLYLCVSIPQGVFFNGDGSLKALLAQQFSKGQWRADLIESTEPWIRRLWQEGLYAYQAPFVYYLNERYYISFPFPFSLLTSFFYKVFGYGGFYVIPILSTWILWVSFYGMGPSLSLESAGIFLGLIILIFSSHLTVYSAMYWEHTLAVTLGSIGIFMAFFTPDREGVIKMIIGGVLVGLSACFRSECIALIATLTFLVFLGLTPRQNFILESLNSSNLRDIIAENGREFIFVGSMVFSLLLYWLCNKLIYNRFLGIHALLILDEFSWSRRIKEAVTSFSQLKVSLFEYFPVCFLPLIYFLNFSGQKVLTEMENKVIYILLTALVLGGFILLSKGRKNLREIVRNNRYFFLLLFPWSYLLFQVNITLNNEMIFIYSLSLLYTVGVACLVDVAPGEFIVGGKQWGPRYLLPMIPFLTWLTVEQLGILWQSGNALVAYGSLALLLILVGRGMYKNIYQGIQYFWEAHQGIGPAVKRLDRYSHPVIAFSHQYAAQALGFSLKEKKTFFCVQDSPKMIQLCQGLIEQNISEFLYVCYPHLPCQLLQEDLTSLKFEYQGQLFTIHLTDLGIFGKYPVYEVTISVQIENESSTHSQPVERELVCTLLPTYNEKDNITQLIERLLESVSSPYLILVIDDNSPDGTWKIVEEIAQKYPLSPNDPDFEAGVILKRRIDERGLTSALQRGIDEAINLYNAKIITWMDCDLSMPPEDVPKLVKAIQEDQADMAVGSRWISGGDDVAHGIMARVLSWIINQMAIILLGSQVHDYTSGFIATRREVLQQIPLQGDYGEYCIDLLCRASRLGYKLVEVPYLCVPRIYGESKTGINLWDYLDKGRNYVTTIGKLWLNNS